eukprot:2923809-Alexandrium_andersonii.AAC.1
MPRRPVRAWAREVHRAFAASRSQPGCARYRSWRARRAGPAAVCRPVSYTHLRAHETSAHL